MTCAEGLKVVNKWQKPLSVGENYPKMQFQDAKYVKTLFGDRHNSLRILSRIDVLCEADASDRNPRVKEVTIDFHQVKGPRMGKMDVAD